MGRTSQNYNGAIGSAKMVHFVGMNVQFEQRKQIAPGIWQYVFRPERPLDYIPGQYVELQLAGVPSDPRGAKRTFSLVSLPTDETISFVVKHFELQSPYKHILQHLQLGETASVGDAMGDLILPKSAAQPLVFVAGGIGIASYVSMLAHLSSLREERPIYLFYQLRSRHEQIYKDLTNGYPLQLKQIVLAPNQLQAADIQDTTPPSSIIYLSGSQKFVEGLRTSLTDLGTPHEQIVFDYYDGYSDL